MADSTRDRLGLAPARSTPSPSPYRTSSYLDVGYSPASSSQDLKALESGYGETPMSTGAAFFTHHTPFSASSNGGGGTPAMSRSSSFVFPSGIAGASSGLLERRRTSGGGGSAGGLCGIGNAAGQGERWEAGTGWRSRMTLIWGLRFGWIVLVIWCEIGEFFHSVSGCHFPDSALSTSPPQNLGTDNSGTPFPTHVVLLADPQIPHPTLSYPGRNSVLQKLTTWFIDLYMRKSWNVLRRLGRIDAVIVAGDMMDWGRGAFDDAEQVINSFFHQRTFLISAHYRYQTYVNRFKSIFQLPEGIPMYYVPGNHDLGLGPNRLFSPYAKQRYAEK
ncbi:hypothetical protein QFC19_001272 [Naganishia cerealis]|uniref:Uncharacterized protein n=1 Tax=Naganishia cerealis TaxID=610337 RepID=A0ACC2WIS1_9TREE|nr:hypothetical protein QFC19_001272 [Naganishia cerealis]